MNTASLVNFQQLLDNTSFGILLVATLLYWVSVAFRRLPLVHELGSAAATIAALTTAGLLGARWLETGHFPISNFYESLFFLCWCVLAVHLAAEQFSRQRLVGAFTMPVALGLAAFASLVLPESMQEGGGLVPALKSNWLMMHVSVIVLSYAALMVGSLVAIAYLVVTRGQEALELRGSSVGTGSFQRAESSGMATLAIAQPLNFLEQAPLPIADAPALRRSSLAETLDNVSYRLIGLGFPLLTVGIIAGAVWANEAWGSYWSWDPKETWSLITWFIYAAYLHARLTQSWQGKRPAILAAVGFVAVWVTYLGVNFLAQGLHSYGWLS
ncbi:c-type cytochrome biogenesis protein CcsB [Anthocerotibacter panamensis]|uniref:c-type cytochrome biogenesis protein CcsB n=1 Tax=Anthocerotibacter panamensis TaxID=2857077 RepID=UPI001C406185|nr:c-type cytochrome biogenesis protein CcsB [Anthocerotibacter panamensis]